MQAKDIAKQLRESAAKCDDEAKRLRAAAQALDPRGRKAKSK